MADVLMALHAAGQLVPDHSYQVCWTLTIIMTYINSVFNIQETSKSSTDLQPKLPEPSAK